MVKWSSCMAFRSTFLPGFVLHGAFIGRILHGIIVFTAVIDQISSFIVMSSWMIGISKTVIYDAMHSILSKKGFQTEGRDKIYTWKLRSKRVSKHSKLLQF